MSKERWSAQKKQDIVIRVIRGESLEELSREYKVTVSELLEWQRLFLQSGREGLKVHGKSPVEKELENAEKKIGRMAMELELYKKKRRFPESEKKEFIAEYVGKESEYNGKPFPARTVLSVAGLSSAAYYGRKSSVQKKKRGPKTEINDDELLSLIKEEIAGLKFYGMGYIKIWIRINRKLEKKGLSVGKARTYRVMKDNNLLQKSPEKPVKNKHDGKIITGKPNVMWATDGKRFWTRKEGWCWFFGVSDHFNSEIIAFHTAGNGVRFRA
ncbi:MAG: DUF1153 domain-containing protein [Brevinematales bacterium]|nr:DUF1153 domain-containing protein [Brevinematales bacterium]